MSCLPITPFTTNSGCAPRMGGIRSVIWAPRARLYPIAEDYNPQNTEYSLDMGTTGTTGTSIYRIPVRSGSFTSSAQVSDDGSTYYRDELTFIPEADPEAAAAMLAALSSASDDGICLIAEDYNGRNWVMGYGFTNPSDGQAAAFPVWLSGGSLQSGSARSDLNGGQITIASVHPLPAAIAYIGDVPISNPNDF